MTTSTLSVVLLSHSRGAVQFEFPQFPQFPQAVFDVSAGAGSTGQPAGCVALGATSKKSAGASLVAPDPTMVARPLAIADIDERELSGRDMRTVYPPTL
jgi:hypothetical protein